MFDAIIGSLKDIGLNQQIVESENTKIESRWGSMLVMQLSIFVVPVTVMIWPWKISFHLFQKILNLKVVAVLTYYCTSGLCTKELKSLIPKMKSLPAHHEVRFAQHLMQLREAVLSNLDGCRLHWEKIVVEPSVDYKAMWITR